MGFIDTATGARMPSENDGASFVIFNATKVDAAGTERDFWAQVSDGLIARTGTGGTWRSLRLARTIDAGGGYLLPGFIDLHRHGGAGFANDDGVDSALSTAAFHRRHGTTRSIVSFVAAPIPELLARLAWVADLSRRDDSILGSHLEGPFLADERRGAHNPRYLTSPTPYIVEAILDAAQGTLGQITIDPARDGALDAIRRFADAGVVVAVGHTSASYELTVAAFAHGARLLTHTFNAMPAISARHPGPVVAALDTPNVYLELILDGKHVHPRVAAGLLRAAPHRVALITDAMSASGCVDGGYRIGDLDVVVKDGTARLSDGETLAGSTVTLDASLQFGRSAGVELIPLVEAITATPARILGLGASLGLVHTGMTADLVLLDGDLVVREVHLGTRLGS